MPGGMTVPPLELPWFKRPRVTYARDDYAFGEINNKAIGDAFDATILEVAFHDSRDDARLRSTTSKSPSRRLTFLAPWPIWPHGPARIE